jgi:hypothetical protein
MFWRKRPWRTATALLRRCAAQGGGFLARVRCVPAWGLRRRATRFFLRSDVFFKLFYMYFVVYSATTQRARQVRGGMEVSWFMGLPLSWDDEAKGVHIHRGKCEYVNAPSPI